MSDPRDIQFNIRYVEICHFFSNTWALNSSCLSEENHATSSYFQRDKHPSLFPSGKWYEYPETHAHVPFMKIGFKSH
jgi:hypothetical protein